MTKREALDLYKVLVSIETKIDYILSAVPGTSSLCGTISEEVMKTVAEFERERQTTDVLRPVQNIRQEKQPGPGI
jgi:hypothetical protein|tara:strand:+ start:81 stop:305 length:225 start_codon:yes stop_codon:yes gene_type:complete